MQIVIQTNLSNKPKVFELTEDKFRFLMQFVDYLADDIVDENSVEYKQFFENEIHKAMKTKRIKSGNSLREIIL
jgi:hypothetical protein